jgi:hypothetical protein
MIYISEIRDPVFIWVGLSLAPAVQGCGLFWWSIYTLSVRCLLLECLVAIKPSYILWGSVKKAFKLECMGSFLMFFQQCGVGLCRTYPKYLVRYHSLIASIGDVLTLLINLAQTDMQSWWSTTRKGNLWAQLPSRAILTKFGIEILETGLKSLEERKIR